MQSNLEKELIFSTSRSSGPGGQNVNKVNSRVELRFNIPASKILNQWQIERLMTTLSHRVTSSGDILVVISSSRSQLKNKELAIKIFLELINNALKIPKKRIKTRPTKASRLKRRESKQINAQKKARRRKISFD